MTPRIICAANGQSAAAVATTPVVAIDNTHHRPDASSTASIAFAATYAATNHAGPAPIAITIPPSAANVSSPAATAVVIARVSPATTRSLTALVVTMNSGQSGKRIAR